MCGIVGAIAQRDVGLLLLEGLKRLEYRGYDSAGCAVVDRSGELQVLRVVGKVAVLQEALQGSPMAGAIGIAHTRWATHGEPTESNAHPHVSQSRFALVHNGIIENYQQLREELSSKGYTFTSDTDTEVIIHLISEMFQSSGDLLEAVHQATQSLEGAYAFAVIDKETPDQLIATRRGSPLVLGLGIGEHFLASDTMALLPVTRRFIYLEDGDFVRLTRSAYSVFDENLNEVQRDVVSSDVNVDQTTRGGYKHFMQKEIFEQPLAVQNTLRGSDRALSSALHAFGPRAEEILQEIEAISIIACGTSFHAGMIAKYWFESLVGIPVQVEIASEFRYRQKVILPKTLLITISQSGETADTLAGLREHRDEFLSTLSICNVPESSLVRESELVFLTHAGPEVGVASTKAFTAQLSALAVLAAALAHQKRHEDDRAKSILASLQSLPDLIKQVLKLDGEIEKLSAEFEERYHALFIGRGLLYPIAKEGALKLKEISYIHAEGYPGGELKHGPLALVDQYMPVVALAHSGLQLEKILSNVQEVAARGGLLFVFGDSAACDRMPEEALTVVLPDVEPMLAPIVYTIPMQLLAYHVAVRKGTDVDQPRNLAKSVTVE